MIALSRSPGRSAGGTGTRMRVVVGLGNPGTRYELTRHNLGFMVVDQVAARVFGPRSRAPGLSLPMSLCSGLRSCSRSGWRKEGQALLCSGRVELPASGESTDLLLVKPLTFMNASGEAVGPLVNALGIELANLLVVCDDLDLPCGQLRLRPRGSAGGHRGLASVIAAVGEGFPRLRVGIDRPPEGVDVIDYVLGEPDEKEWECLAAAVDQAAEAVLVWLEEGIAAAMSRFNTRRSRGRETAPPDCSTGDVTKAQ